MTGFALLTFFMGMFLRSSESFNSQDILQTLKKDFMRNIALLSEYGNESFETVGDDVYKQTLLIEEKSDREDDKMGEGDSL